MSELGKDVSEVGIRELFTYDLDDPETRETTIREIELRIEIGRRKIFLYQRRLISLHKAYCYQKDCRLDGGPEHAEAFPVDCKVS